MMTATAASPVFDRGRLRGRNFALLCHRQIRWLPAGFSILLIWVAVAGSARAAADPLVIWLSLDGVRHDYPDLAHFPGLSRLAAEGIRAGRLIPVFPTSTFPNHVAMATCARTDRHGIVGNRFFDTSEGEFDYENEASWILAEPIWASAERQGVRSAVYFWVGSETAWRGRAASYRIRPFDDDVPESEKVDQILRWIDLPKTQRPGLILSYWRGTDRIGHLKGPDHPGVAKQLGRQDEQLVRLLEGLDTRDAWGYTTLFVTSDHGMTRVDKEIDVPAALSRIGVKARIDSGSAVSFVSLSDPQQLEIAEAALGKIPGHTVFRSTNLPEALHLYHASRTGDLVLIADPPYYFARKKRVEAIVQSLMRKLGWETGAHGYSTTHPDMAGILFVMGRGVARGDELDSVSNLDLAPTVSKLLGIDAPAHCEGSVLPGIGAVGS